MIHFHHDVLPAHVLVDEAGLAWLRTWALGHDQLWGAPLGFTGLDVFVGECDCPGRMGFDAGKSIEQSPPLTNRQRNRNWLMSRNIRVGRRAAVARGEGSALPERPDSREPVGERTDPWQLAAGLLEASQKQQEDGCCLHPSWRKRLCSYHEGMSDGMDMLLAAMRKERSRG